MSVQALVGLGSKKEELSSSMEAELLDLETLAAGKKGSSLSKCFGMKSI